VATLDSGPMHSSRLPLTSTVSENSVHVPPGSTVVVSVYFCENGSHLTEAGLVFVWAGLFSAVEGCVGQ